MNNSISFEFDPKLNQAVDEMDRLTGYVVCRGMQWTEIYSGLLKGEIDLITELLEEGYPDTFDFSFNKDLEEQEQYVLIARYLGEEEAVDYV